MRFILINIHIVASPMVACPSRFVGDEAMANMVLKKWIPCPIDGWNTPETMVDVGMKHPT